MFFVRFTGANITKFQIPKKSKFGQKRPNFSFTKIVDFQKNFLAAPGGAVLTPRPPSGGYKRGRKTLGFFGLNNSFFRLPPQGVIATLRCQDVLQKFLKDLFGRGTHGFRPTKVGKNFIEKFVSRMVYELLTILRLNFVHKFKGSFDIYSNLILADLLKFSKHGSWQVFVVVGIFRKRDQNL